MQIEETGDKIRFEVDKAISKDEAIELQENAGKEACAYGFYDFKTIGNKTSWYCYATCD